MGAVQLEYARAADAILSRAADAKRYIVAIAGPPGAGKSTLGAGLAQALAGRGEKVALVSMDGFHYDDAVLKARGLSHCKGAPETFDFAGFHNLLRRIRAHEPDIAIPIFDRSMELSRAAAAIVEEDARLILVEGNYLLLDEPPWSALGSLFDFSIYLDVPRSELARRLLARWDHHGRGSAEARHWVEMNDLPNADRVANRCRNPDMVL